MANVAEMAEGVTLAAERLGSRSNGAPVDGPRPLRRRTTLPTGRAVVGGFLIALAALGIFAAYTTATARPTVRYVVASHDLAIGERITENDLALLPMDLPDVVSRNAAFTDPRRLVGTTVVGPIRRAELVQAGAVVRKASGANDVEVSFSIEAARALGGTLLAGETVDVLATFGSGNDAYTVAVVRGARVLSSDVKKGTLADARTQTITLALADRADALAITHATNAGEVTLVRTTGSGPAAAGDVYRAPAAQSPSKTQGG